MNLLTSLVPKHPAVVQYKSEILEEWSNRLQNESQICYYIRKSVLPDKCRFDIIVHTFLFLDSCYQKFLYVKMV